MSATTAAFLAVAVATHFPEGHVSYDPRWTSLLPAIALLLALFSKSRRKPVAVLIALAAVATPFILDATHLLMQYERWLKRSL